MEVGRPLGTLFFKTKIFKTINDRGVSNFHQRMPNVANGGLHKNILGMFRTANVRTQNGNCKIFFDKMAKLSVEKNIWISVKRELYLRYEKGRTPQIFKNTRIHAQENEGSCCQMRGEYCNLRCRRH